MKSHEVDFEIFGDDMQVVEIELDPGETVIAEAGSMNWMEDGISFEAKMGDGSKPDQGLMGKLVDAAKRKLTGESLFMTHFTNTGSGKKRVAFASPYPGKIMPINLSEYQNELLCQKDSFLCAAMGTQIDIAFTKHFGAGFFGGEGLFLATLRGSGTVMLQSLPFSRLADRVLRNAPSIGGKRTGEGSVLGRLGTMIDGN